MTRDFHENMRIDRRRVRAMALASHITQIVAEHVDSPQVLRDIGHDIFDKLYESGVEIMTDQMREEAGLPARDPKGWTTEELLAYEKCMLEAMLKPFPSVIITKDGLR